LVFGNTLSIHAGAPKASAKPFLCGLAAAPFEWFFGMRCCSPRFTFYEAFALLPLAASGVRG